MDLDQGQPVVDGCSGGAPPAILEQLHQSQLAQRLLEMHLPLFSAKRSIQQKALLRIAADVIALRLGRGEEMRLAVLQLQPELAIRPHRGQPAGFGHDDVLPARLAPAGDIRGRSPAGVGDEDAFQAPVRWSTSLM